VSQHHATKSSKANIVFTLANNPINSRTKERIMKKLIALLIFASLIYRMDEPGQIEEDEIRLLIARAPVVEAMAEAEEMQVLAVWHWLMALAYTGHTKEAFAAEAKIRKWMSSDDANEALALGLAIGGKVDEALSVARRIKGLGGHGLSVTILSKAGRFSEALNEAREMEAGGERDESFQQIARDLAMRGEINQALKTAGEIKNKKSLNETLSFAMKDLLKTGKIGDAKSIAERIQSDHNARSPLTSAIIDVVDDLVNDDAQENALAMVDLIEDEAARSRTLSVIAESFIEAGRLDKALEAARKMKDEPLLSITLVKVAAAKDNKGASEQVGGFEADDRTAVKRLLNAGKIDQALTVAQNIKDEDGRSEAFAAAAEFLFHSGSYRQARLAADRCPSPTLRMFLYLKIFNELSFRRNPQLRAQVQTIVW
jgi:hypothetical protein